MNIICTFCNKKYASYSSRSNHIKKYHTSKVSFNVSNVSDDVSNNVSNVSNNSSLNCKKCNKIFNSRTTRWRHEQKCDDKKIKIDDILEMKQENLEMKKEIKELRGIIQQSLKIHPKQLNKINNQLNQQNNINNNNNYIQLGREDFNNVLNNNEKLAILEKKGRSLTKFIETIYQNDKFKKFQNIYITNLRSNTAYKYDDKYKKFIAVNKEELLDDILEERIFDIQTFYDELQNKLDEYMSNQIHIFLERLELEPIYKNTKKDEIILALYNNRESAGLNYKEANKEIEI
jgi:hypothetical protein